MKVRIARISWVLILTACTSAAESASTFATRDSSGVRIVEYTDSASPGRSFTLAEQPVFRFGDDAGERELGFVFGGTLLPDGGAVIADGLGKQEVLRLGPDGALRSVLARSGEGPEEIGSVGGLRSLGGDTILIQDFRNARMTVFAGDSLIRSVSTASDRALARGTRVVDREGDTLLATLENRASAPVDGWIEGRLVRMALSSAAIDTVGSYPSVDPAGLVQGKRPAFPAFGKAIGSGGTFLTARSDLAQLTWWSSRGSAQQILRWNPPLVYPKEGDLADWIELLKPDMKRINAGMSDAEIDQFMARQLEDLQVDPSRPYPLFMDVIGDGTGGAWLSDFSLLIPMGRPGTDWTMVSAAGERVGRVHLPPSFRLLEVQGSRVLGVVTDSMDVQSVALYELRKLPPPPDRTVGPRTRP